MISESSTQGREHQLSEFYQEYILATKNYSFLIIDKSAKHNKRYSLYEGDSGKCFYVNGVLPP